MKPARPTALFSLFAALLLAASNSQADIRINEFMASNDQTLVDDDGDASDWIELYNDGNAAVNLTGWYLTDDSAELDKWALPAISLAADDYLLVYASSKDRLASAGYHTNFKLGKGGEYLGLVRPDATTIEDEFSPEYPQQTDDVSFGVAASGEIGYLQSPTPAGANSRLILPGVTFSPASQMFTGTLSIALTTDSPLAAGDTLRYTLDGSEPTSSSTLYTGPLSLNNSADIRAGVFRGAESSPFSSGQYIDYATDLIGFNSTLPLVVIHTRGEEVSSTDDYTPTSTAIINVTGGSDSLNASLNHLGNAGLRIRGSSSALFPKKSYRMELWDDEQDDIDVNVLGMGAESDWLLVAPGFMDRNMIANPFMSDLANDLGVKGMQWRFVEVFLHTGAGAVQLDDYQGIYLLFESIKVGDNRIDISTLSTSDTSEPDITGGYIFKRDRSEADEFFFLPSRLFDSMGEPINRTVVHRPKLDKLAPAQRNYVENYFDDFEATILGNDPLNTDTGYRLYIEERSWIDAHILAVLSKEADQLRLSNYFYKNRGARVVNGPLWDYDRSLNSEDSRNDNPETLNNAGQVNPFVYSWWGSLFDIAHFDELYRRRWHALRKGPLATDALFARVDSLGAMLLEPYPREYARWGGVEGYGSRYGGRSNFQGELDALKDWLGERLTFLDGFLANPGAPGCTSSTLDYPLIANNWAMLSLPCQPPAGESITSIFGDDISGNYTTDWAVFIFNPTLGESGSYTLLAADELPEPGQGFWIIQNSDELAVLDLPAGSTPVSSTSTTPGCAEGSACTAIPLTATSRWMLLGNPIRTSVPKQDLRVVDSNGPCAAPAGCTLATAVSADILPSPFYTYFREASSAYHNVASVGLLNEWSAFWAFGGAASGGPSAQLVMPTTSP